MNKELIIDLSVSNSEAPPIDLGDVILSLIFEPVGTLTIPVKVRTHINYSYNSEVANTVNVYSRNAGDPFYIFDILDCYKTFSSYEVGGYGINTREAIDFCTELKDLGLKTQILIKKCVNRELQTEEKSFELENLTAEHLSFYFRVLGLPIIVLGEGDVSYGDINFGE